MEEDIKVSVFCLAYNHEKYIRETLEGFVSQKTNFNFEVLVHDDASTDETTNIIREYEKKYPHIIKPIYQKENQYSKGGNLSYRYLYPRAKGKYVALCEGDDYWTHSLKLQMQYDFLENHPEVSLISHRAKRITREGQILATKAKKDIFEKKLDMQTVVDHLSEITTASMFYRKSHYTSRIDFLKTIRGYDYVLKILLLSDGYAYIFDKEMSVYRVNAENSWTQRIASNSQLYRQHIAQSIETLEKIKSFLDGKYDDVINGEILKREFNFKLLNEEFSELKRNPYRKVYKQLSFKQKLLITFPWLVKIKRKIKR